MSALAAGEDTEGEEEGLIVEDDSGDEGAGTPPPHVSSSTYVDPNSVGTLFVAAGTEERAFRPAPSAGGDLKQRLTASGDVSGLPSASSTQPLGPSSGGSVLDASHAVNLGARPASGRPGRRKARKPQSTRKLSGGTGADPAPAGDAHTARPASVWRAKGPRHKKAGRESAAADEGGASSAASVAQPAPAPARVKPRPSPTRGAGSTTAWHGSLKSELRRPRRRHLNGSDAASAGGKSLPGALATMTERQLLQLVMARSAKEAEEPVGPAPGTTGNSGTKRPDSAASPASSTGGEVRSKGGLQAAEDVGAPQAKRRRGSGSNGWSSGGRSQQQVSADSVVSHSEDGSDLEYMPSASRAEIAQARGVIRSLQLRRRALGKLMASSAFESVVTGCFVRAKEVTHGNVVGRVYRVQGVKQLPKAYTFNGRRTRRRLLVEQGQFVRHLRLIYASNAAVTDAEVAHWLDHGGGWPALPAEPERLEKEQTLGHALDGAL